MYECTNDKTVSTYTLAIIIIIIMIIDIVNTLLLLHICMLRIWFFAYRFSFFLFRVSLTRTHCFVNIVGNNSNDNNDCLAISDHSYNYQYTIQMINATIVIIIRTIIAIQCQLELLPYSVSWWWYILSLLYVLHIYTMQTLPSYIIICVFFSLSLFHIFEFAHFSWHITTIMTIIIINRTYIYTYRYHELEKFLYISVYIHFFLSMIHGHKIHNGWDCFWENQ